MACRIWLDGGALSPPGASEGLPYPPVLNQPAPMGFAPQRRNVMANPGLRGEPALEVLKQSSETVTGVGIEYF